MRSGRRARRLPLALKWVRLGRRTMVVPSLPLVLVVVATREMILLRDISSMERESGKHSRRNSIVPVPLRIYKNIPEVTLLAVEGHRLHLPPPDGAGNGVERLPGVVDPEGLHVEGPEAVFAVHDAV